MWLFIHRISFMLARAVVIAAIPIIILLLGGRMADEGSSLSGWLTLIFWIFTAIIPILLLKFVFFVRCPGCGSRLEREFAGAGSYDCANCGKSYS